MRSIIDASSYFSCERKLCSVWFDSIFMTSNVRLKSPQTENGLVKLGALIFHRAAPNGFGKFVNLSTGKIHLVDRVKRNYHSICYVSVEHRSQQALLSVVEREKSLHIIVTELSNTLSSLQ